MNVILVSVYAGTWCLVSVGGSIKVCTREGASGVLFSSSDPFCIDRYPYDVREHLWRASGILGF